MSSRAVEISSSKGGNQIAGGYASLRAVKRGRKERHLVSTTRIYYLTDSRGVPAERAVSPPAPLQSG